MRTNALKRTFITCFVIVCCFFTFVNIESSHADSLTTLTLDPGQRETLTVYKDTTVRFVKPEGYASMYLRYNYPGSLRYPDGYDEGISGEIPYYDLEITKLGGYRINYRVFNKGEGYEEGIYFLHAVECAHENCIQEVALEPTCTSEGTMRNICNDCGKYLYSKIPQVEHEVSYYYVTKKPTCTSGGEEEGYCVSCHKKITRKTEKLGHKYETSITKEPTCVTEGQESSVCANCGDTVTQVIPATNQHIWDKGKIVKEPTFTTTGTIEYSCTTCSKTKTETIPKVTTNIPIKSAVVDPAIYKYTGTPVKPTLKVTGSDGKVLRETTDYTVVVSNNNRVGTGLITVTGKGNYTGTMSITFQITDTLPSGSGTLEGGGTWTQYDDGKLVISGSGSVSLLNKGWKQNVTSLVVEEGITKLESVYFSGSSTLKSVDLPSSLGLINANAFSKCTALETVSCGSSIGEHCFYGCTSLKKVVLKDGAYNIWDGAFEGCTSLESIDLAPSISYIGGKVIKGCTKLHIIRISDWDAYNRITFGAYSGYDSEYRYVSNLTDKDYFDRKVVGPAKLPINESMFQLAYTTVSAIEGVSDYEFRPAVTAKGLTEGTDYEIKYENNVSPGTASVVINGIKKYTGTVRLHFTITEPEGGGVVLPEYPEGDDPNQPVSKDKDGHVTPYWINFQNTMLISSKTLKVHGYNLMEGDKIKVVCAGKTYTKTVSKTKKNQTFKFKIGKHKMGTKITIKLYNFKGEYIGSDSSKYYYSYELKRGMTKKQAKNTVKWGKPTINGNTWYFEAAYGSSAVAKFRKGKIYYLHKHYTY